MEPAFFAYAAVNMELHILQKTIAFIVHSYHPRMLVGNI